MLNYQKMIGKLIRTNNINILDAIEYSNIITNKNVNMPINVIEQVKNHLAKLYKNRCY